MPVYTWDHTPPIICIPNNVDDHHQTSVIIQISSYLVALRLVLGRAMSTQSYLFYLAKWLGDFLVQIKLTLFTLDLFWVHFRHNSLPSGQHFPLVNQFLINMILYDSFQS